ncbi:MAG: DUF4142 domain-containing protein [Sulfurifustis sp.]
MKGFHFSSVLAILAALAFAPAYAADMGKADSSGKPSSSDQKFAKKAATDNLSEIELADVAKNQASQDMVKQYAEHIANDHQQANEKLKSIASQKGIDLPNAPDSKHKSEKDKLAKRQGADFDKAFVDAMVKDHKNTVKEFEKEAKDGKDPELKQFASSMLPGLRKHLQEAQQLQASTKAAERKS